MDKLNDLLRTPWGSEPWIAEGWEKITEDEKDYIKSRVDELFKDGLPFDIKHGKLFYIYLFSMLAQFEVLAIQVPLRFESRLSNPVLRKQLHTQLLDEIFHGIVFTKILYLLCSPYSMPPAYNDTIESLCNFIRNEDCPKVALMLLNLIGEGWIEEIFSAMQQHGIASEVFNVILSDERRHVSEADLYREIGIADKRTLRDKLAYFEEQLLTNVFFQYQYSISFGFLLGIDGTDSFLKSLHNKHSQQLKKINLQPGKSWKTFMSMAPVLFPDMRHQALPMSHARKVFMTQWGNPSDPTMVGEFDLNINRLDFFNKVFPPETLTTLMLQAVSLALSMDKSFRTHLSYSEFYTCDDAYVGLVVKLPDCSEHIGTIVFKNCHEISVQQLSCNIREIVQKMVFCYKKREQLENMYPFLETVLDKTVADIVNGVYPFPMPGNSITSVSNVGNAGYVRAKSPLRSNEGLKFTLLEVDRKMVWNKKTGQFEEQDQLPVSISADHRIFPGNLPIPKLIQQCFDQMFEKMTQNQSPVKKNQFSQSDPSLEIIEQLLKNNLESGYQILVLLQTLWMDSVSVDKYTFSKTVKKHFESTPI